MNISGVAVGTAGADPRTHTHTWTHHVQTANLLVERPLSIALYFGMLTILYYYKK